MPKPPAPPPTSLPIELTEPPPPRGGQLVPNSRYPDADWAMAAHRLAAGWPAVQVARALGCHRNTIWRAYYTAPGFRERVEWERACLKREAAARIRSLSHQVAAQIEQAVAQGEMKTIRWLADRMGLTAIGPLEAAGEPPGPDVVEAAGAVPETGLPDDVPLDWQDAFAPDLPLPRP